MTEEKTCINPLEDQRASALKHYHEASSAIHHWSSFVASAIKAYNPAHHLEPMPYNVVENGTEWIYQQFNPPINEAAKDHAVFIWDADITKTMFSTLERISRKAQSEQDFKAGAEWQAQQEK